MVSQDMSVLSRSALSNSTTIVGPSKGIRMIRRKLLHTPIYNHNNCDVPNYLGSPLRACAVSYWCLNGHHTPRVWSAAAAIPTLWDCRQCGLPAGRDRNHPPHPLPPTRFKTPLAHLLERRSEDELEALLNEALDRLQARRLARLVPVTSEESGKVRA